MSMDHPAGKQTLSGTAEARRLAEARQGVPWRRWGPYLSERQWGTVREDYSADGDAWDYFPHDHARSRAYRWGEDGIAGFGDDQLQSVPRPRAVERPRPDPQGAAVRPDQRARAITARTSRSSTTTSTPRRRTRYMKMLYKYPQAAFPYARLVEENRRRGRERAGVRAARHRRLRRRPLLRRRVEYAKAAPDDILMQVTVAQPRPGRGAAARAAAALVPQHLVVEARRREADAAAHRCRR